MSRSRIAAVVAGAVAGTVLLTWLALSRFSRGSIDAKMPSASCQADLVTALAAQERFRAERGRYAEATELIVTLPSVTYERSGKCPDCQVFVRCHAGAERWSIGSAPRTVNGVTTAAATPVRD